MPSDRDDFLREDWEVLAPKKPRPQGNAPQKTGILDVNELRRATQQAIQEGADKKAHAEDAQAESILLKATEKARKAAGKGLNTCRIVKLRPTNFEYTSKKVTLKSVGKVVFDRLQQAGMRVEIEHQFNNTYWDSEMPDVWIVLKW